MDVQVFLKPISDSEPVGKYLRWDREYDELEEARRSDDDTSEDLIWRREAKHADWDRVVGLGTQILLDKSKDLQIVAFMTEAWAHLRGLPGIGDGLDLMRAVQDAFWERAYPEYSDSDRDLRRGVYEFLDDPKLLPLLIRSTALTGVEGAPNLTYSYVKYKEALDNDKRFNQATSEQQRSLLDGSFRGEEFDAAAAGTPRGFYVELIEQLQACRATVERFNEQLVERWPASPRERPPQLSEVLTALEDVEREAKRLLARKPAPRLVQEPPPVEPPPPHEEESEPGPDERPTEEPDEGSSPRPDPVSRPHRPSPASAPPSSTDEAIGRIVEAAHYLRRADPADPVSYLVLRAIQAGGLYRGEGAPASGELPPPASEVRERLYQLSRGSDEEQWAGLLDESEQALGRPEGRGWLDPHFYTARALESLQYDGAARACKALLAACLQEHEQWPASNLRDGTTCASGPTREWLDREFRGTNRTMDLAGRIGPINPTAVAASGDDAPSTSGTTDGRAEPPDPWEEAQGLLRSDRLKEAISVMIRAVRQARTGRERFLRTLQQAELCLGSDRPGLALPLLEMLAQQIDDLRLDQWEESSVCARVLSHLYRCLKGNDQVRAAAIYNRLCQLDAAEALLLGST